MRLVAGRHGRLPTFLEGLWEILTFRGMPLWDRLTWAFLMVRERATWLVLNYRCFCCGDRAVTEVTSTYYCAVCEPIHGKNCMYGEPRCQNRP